MGFVVIERSVVEIAEWSVVIGSGEIVVVD